MIFCIFPGFTTYFFIKTKKKKKPDDTTVMFLSEKKKRPTLYVGLLSSFRNRFLFFYFSKFHLLYRCFPFETVLITCTISTFHLQRYDQPTVRKPSDYLFIFFYIPSQCESAKTFVFGSKLPITIIQPGDVKVIEWTVSINAYNITGDGLVYFFFYKFVYGLRYSEWKLGSGNRI